MFSELLISVATIMAAETFTRDTCDARAVAPYIHSLSIEQHIEVIDWMEEVGGVTAAHAAQLRALINEAHQVSDLDAWVEMHCAPKEQA